MKKWLICAGVLLCAGMLGACGGKTEVTESVQTETKETETEIVFSEDMLDQIKVNVGNYKGLKVTIPYFGEVTDQYVDSQIEAMMNGSTVDQIDGDAVIQSGDMVSIDYQMYDGTQPVGEPMENYYLKIGSGILFDGADESLVGAKGGDVIREEVTLPEFYPDSALAGKKVTLEMTVHGIVSQGTATFDEAYIEEITEGECHTLAEYREYVRKQLEANNEAQKKVAVENAVWQALIAQMEIIDLPEAIVQAQVNDYMAYDKDNAENEGMTMEDYVKDWYGIDYDTYVKELTTMAQDDLLVKVAMKEIIKLENLDAEAITEDEIKAFAESQGYADAEMMKEALGDEVVNQLIMKARVTKILADNAVVEEEKQQ